MDRDQLAYLANLRGANAFTMKRHIGTLIRADTALPDLVTAVKAALELQHFENAERPLTELEPEGCEAARYMWGEFSESAPGDAGGIRIYAELRRTAGQYDHTQRQPGRGAEAPTADRLERVVSLYFDAKNEQVARNEQQMFMKTLQERGAKLINYRPA